MAMAGQIQGGVAMSVGYAFGENCQFKEGRLLNDSMSTYLMPTAMDLPRIQSLHVDGYEPSGPMGRQGRCRGIHRIYRSGDRCGN